MNKEFSSKTRVSAGDWYSATQASTFPTVSRSMSIWNLWDHEWEAKHVDCWTTTWTDGTTAMRRIFITEQRRSAKQYGHNSECSTRPRRYSTCDKSRWSLWKLRLSPRMRWTRRSKSHQSWMSSWKSSKRPSRQRQQSTWRTYTRSRHCLESHSSRWQTALTKWRCHSSPPDS